MKDKVKQKKMKKKDDKMKKTKGMKREKRTYAPVVSPAAATMTPTCFECDDI